MTLAAFDAEWNGADVVVTWETAAELDTLGFNLWRSASGGKFEQVNATLIPPASPGSVLGGVYEVVDSDVTLGEQYAYKLEEVETGGAVNWYGPVTLTANAPTAVSVQAFAAGSALWALVPVALAALAPWWCAGSVRHQPLRDLAGLFKAHTVCATCQVSFRSWLCKIQGPTYQVC